MLAAVIPCRRTARDKNFFVYKILPHQMAQPGAVVVIELRKTKLYGVVHKIIKTSPLHNLKALKEVLDKKYWLSARQVIFLQWFARYYFISLPTALKTIFFFPSKKELNPEKFLQNTYDNVSHRYTTAVNNVFGKNQTNLLHYSRRQDCINYYSRLISALKHSVLIIVPEYHDIPLLVKELNCPNHKIVALEQRSKADFFSSFFNNFTKKTRSVVVGTKKNFFLSLLDFPLIIIDQENSPSHKQYDLNPRYHVRSTALALANFFPEKNLFFSSLAPSIDIYSRSLNVIDIRRLAPDDMIKIVDMEEEKMKKNYSWFSQDLIKSIFKGGRHYLFLNRLGKYRFALCQDCSHLLSAESIRCSQCGSTKITYRGKGVKTLESELKRLFPKKQILRIDREQDVDTIKKKLPEAEIIIGTEKIFSYLIPSDNDRLAILSVDHLLTYPHWQSHERVYQILKYVCSLGLPVLLQTHAPQHWLIRAALTDNYKNFYDKETELRKNFNYPPFGDYFLLHNKKKNKKTLCRDYKLLKDLDPSIIVDRVI